MEIGTFLFTSGVIVGWLIFLLYWRKTSPHCSQGGLHAAETDADIMRRIASSGGFGYSATCVNGSVSTSHFIHCTKCGKKLSPYYGPSGE